MTQVAFDTQEFIETLETAGFRTQLAKALSLAVRKSHEIADVATKRDLEDLRKDLTIDITDSHRNLSAEIVGIRKDMEARFQKVDDKFGKTDAKIVSVHKELSAEIADVRKDMMVRFEKTDAKIADVRRDFMTEMPLMRKDIEKSGMKKTIKLSGMSVLAVGMILAVLKIPF